jgi:serine/threonine protein phosphatase PrpC
LNSNIIKIQSNNPSLSKWQQDFEIDSFDISNIKKFLIYTDGISENKTKDGKQYLEFIESDFKKSFTREEFKEFFNDKIEFQEDDITLIYIHKLNILHYTQKLFLKYKQLWL